MMVAAAIPDMEMTANNKIRASDFECGKFIWAKTIAVGKI